LCKEQLKCVLIHVKTSCSYDHVYSNTLELHTQYTQNQKRSLLINSIKDTYIFFLYVSAVSQSITHFINVITINILIIHSDRSWEINIQQEHTLFNDKTLTNHIHLDINIHMNLRFCLLIFLNYMLFIYKNLYEENFLFFSWWFKVFIESLSFFEILKQFICKLIIKLSFKLTFWTRIKIKSSCSHFQPDLSWVAHIFNLMQLDLTENWVNSIWLIKNLSVTLRKLNIEIFPIFNFCIIFLHYLLIESHEEKHEDCLTESHNEKHEEKHDEKHEEKHEEKTWRSFDFDRKSWRENMIESHEEDHEDCSIKLFTSI